MLPLMAMHLDDKHVSQWQIILAHLRMRTRARLKGTGLYTWFLFWLTI